MRGRAAIAVAACSFVASACGGKDPAPRGTPASTAPAVVTYCATEPFASTEPSAVSRFNRAHAGDRITARFRAIADAPVVADKCDVVLTDVTWIGRLAAAGALLDLTKVVERRRDEFMGTSVETGRYDGHYWAMPRYVDVGFLYYKKLVGRPPLTWQEAYGLGRRERGIVYEGAPGESLTVNFLEVAYAAGGTVLTDDGAASALDSPENLRALELMRRGIVRGAAPRTVTRMREEGARRAFEHGATVMRNWGYAYDMSGIGEWTPLQETDLIELPAFGGGEPTAVLAGKSVVVSASARSERAALALADYLTSEREGRRVAAKFRLAPAVTAVYETAWILDHIPYASELERTIEVARPRPVTPYWQEISAAISRNVHAALTGHAAPRAALRSADAEITRILARPLEGSSEQAAVPRPSVGAHEKVVDRRDVRLRGQARVARGLL